MTKYSRDTWKKNDLQSAVQASGGNPQQQANSYQNYNNGYQGTNVNNQDAGTRTHKSWNIFGGSQPRYGSNACQLCARGKLPEDLTLHVTQQSTCGDVHLRLSLLSPDDTMCATGQESYREYCCPQEPDNAPLLKTSFGVFVGVILFWMFTKKVNTTSALRLNEDKAADSYRNMKDGSGIEMKKTSSRSAKSLLNKVYEVAMDSRSHSSKKSAKMKKSRKERSSSRKKTKAYEPPRDSRSKTSSTKSHKYHYNVNPRYDEESYMSQTVTTNGEGTYALDYRSPDSRSRYTQDYDQSTINDQSTLQYSYDQNTLNDQSTLQYTYDQSTLQYEDESTMMETIEASYAPPNVRAPSFHRMQQHHSRPPPHYHNDEYTVDEGTVDHTYAGETINDDTVVAVFTQLV